MQQDVAASFTYIHYAGYCRTDLDPFIDHVTVGPMLTFSPLSLTFG